MTGSHNFGHGTMPAPKPVGAIAVPVKTGAAHPMRPVGSTMPHAITTSVPAATQQAGHAIRSLGTVQRLASLLQKPFTGR